MLPQPPENPIVRLYRGDGAFEPRPLAWISERMERARLPFCAPFSAERIQLLGRYAHQLQTDPRWSGSAPVLALAFWLRKAAVRRMAADFGARAHPQSIATARGIVFHLPPQNVDTLFLYSWAVAFACGNINVVRLPEHMSPTIEGLLDPLMSLLGAGQFEDVFITYPRDAANISERLSAISDCRLVWGGDEKVNLFQRYPLRPGGKSLMFGDRYSHAVLSAAAVAKLDGVGLERLAKQIHDDVRLFDQRACSSPHTVHVLGMRDGADAVYRLMEAVDALARQSPSTDPSHGVAKFAASCAIAAAGAGVSARRLSNEMTVVELAPAEQRGLSIGGGFLSVRAVESVAGIAETLTERDQTLSWFGLEPELFEELARQAAVRGVARLVPIGSALKFDLLWDGYDLLAELTRTVRAQRGI